MKILHIIYDSPKNKWMGGGGAIRTIKIYSQFPNKKDITIICGRFKDKKKETLSGVKYYYLGLNFNYLISRISFILYSLFFIIKNKSKYDLIIEEIGPTPLFLPLFFKNKKIIGSVQVILNNYHKKRGFLGKFLWKVQKISFRKYPKIITVSKISSDKINKIAPKSKIIIIPPGIFLPNFYNNANNNPFGKYFLYLGRMDYYGKGINILLDSFKEIIRKNKNLKLILAGNGEIRDKKLIKKKIDKLKLNKNVLFIGPISGKNKSKIIQNSQFICLPSRSETFGLVVLESFFFSKPVVSSDIPELKEIILNSKGGILFRDGSAKDLSRKINYLLSHPSLIKTLGKNGKKFSKNFSWLKCKNKTLNFYKECLND